MNKNFWFAVVFGLILGGSFTLAAFAEPTTLPANTNSYPPINVGPDTQYRVGRLGIGDGTNLPDQTITDLNTLYTPTVFGAEKLNVRQNATLVGNVDVGGRSIIAGALRVGQLVTDVPMNGEKNNANTRSFPSADPANQYFYSLALPVGASTNLLLSGNYCTFSGTTGSCPPGTVMWKYDPCPSGMGPCYPQTTCRVINPSTSSTSMGTCSTGTYPSISISLTNTSTNTNTCKSTKTYTSTASGTTYWETKTPNETEWTSAGTGSTKQLVVSVGASTATAYNIRARTVVSGLSNTSASVNVDNVYNALCLSYQQGGSGGGSTGL